MKEWRVKYVNLLFLQHVTVWVSYSIGIYFYNLVFSTQANILHAFAISLFLAIIFYVLVFIFSITTSKKYWWLGILAIVPFFISALYFSQLYIYNFLPTVSMTLFNEEVDFDNRIFLKKVIDNFLNLFIYAALYSVTRWGLKNLRQNAANEAAFIRFQIYPHFQQNIMQSFIYEAEQMGNNQFAERISILSSLMTYASESANPQKDRVLLGREVGKVEKMIRLIRDRAGNNDVVDYTINCETDTVKIPPLILLTFIENAVKYGDFTPQDPLEIRISLVDNYFTFSCKNKIASGALEIDSLRIGIRNTQERLAAFFGKRHQLVISEDAGFYSVMLTIEI